MNDISNGKIKVILADDHQMVRAGLRALLEGELGVNVIAEADDGRVAVRLARELSPDIVVMDINMPNLNGIEATRQICANGTGPKVIALTGLGGGRSTSEMIKAGASAYIQKASAFVELGKALAALREGHVYLSPEITGTGAGSAGGNGHDSSAFTMLSAREREVLQLLAEGHAMKEVARTLHLSVKTIETHRANIMRKLNIHSVAGLTKYALREDIISLDT